MTANDIYAVAGDPSAGTVSSGVLATSLGLDQSVVIAVDPAGDLYISDPDETVIWEEAAANGTQWSTSMQAGHAYIVAGSLYEYLDSGDGGKAASAEIDDPRYLSADSLGDLYISDGGLLREMVDSPSSPFAVSPSTSGYVGLTVTQDDGSQVAFLPEASGTCTSPYAIHGDYCALPQYTATLDYSSTTHDYTFTPDPGGTTYTYNSAGELLSEADPAGDTLTISYDSPLPGLR